MNRQCKVCDRWYDPAKVRQGVPQGICTRACSIDSKRLKASAFRIITGNREAAA